jgi:hypothetical protein
MYLVNNPIHRLRLFYLLAIAGTIMWILNARSIVVTVSFMQLWGVGYSEEGSPVSLKPANPSTNCVASVSCYLFAM